MKQLKITQFGNPVLRNATRLVDFDQITSKEIQDLISSMLALLQDKKLGIGLAAPQVGHPIAVAVVELQVTALRDASESVSLVIINPKIIQVFGRREQMWEGCISGGAGAPNLFAKVPRYKKIELEYLDKKAVRHTKIFEGLTAQVIQHEVDHLNGILFVDKVKDTKTYMSYEEYKKMMEL